MKQIKKYILFITITFLCFNNLLVFASNHIILNMVPSGEKLIYSNNPEVITKKIMGTSKGIYSVSSDIERPKAYVCEFYHKNGTDSELNIGLAIQNQSDVPQDVYILNKGIGTCTSKESVLNLSTKILGDYFNKQLYDTVTIPPHSSSIIINTKVASDSLVNGRIKFIVNGDGLRARVFMQKNQKNCKAEDIFTSFTKAKEPYAWMTSGVMEYSTRSVIVDVRNQVDFDLWNASHQNKNEFEILKNDFSGGRPLIKGAKDSPRIHDGNFAIVYDMYFKNYKGKKMFLTPNISNGDFYGAVLMYWASGKGWIPTKTMGKNAKETNFIIHIPNDGHVKLILPGFNCGQFKCIIK